VIAGADRTLICVNGFPQRVAQDAAMNSVAAKRLVVVVVDDDRDTRESLRFLLECEGFAVEDYANGQRFLADGCPPHVGCLVLDVNMPGISGIDVLRRLREEGNMVPAIVVTGQPNSALRDGAMSAGALAFLDKPVIDGRLIDLISQAMDRP
jgi:FixJ family two-component response regulator